MPLSVAHWSHLNLRPVSLSAFSTVFSVGFLVSTSTTFSVGTLSARSLSVSSLEAASSALARASCFRGSCGAAVRETSSSSEQGRKRMGQDDGEEEGEGSGVGLGVPAQPTVTYEVCHLHKTTSAWPFHPRSSA